VGTTEIEEKVPTDFGISSLAVGDEGVWVATWQGTVMRFDP